MSNDLTVLQNNVPAHLQNNEAAAQRNAGALAGTGGGGVDRISLKQSRFRIIEGGEEVAVLSASALNLVLLRVNEGLSKTYYEEEWNPKQEAQAPTCYSDDGDYPSPNADKPQSETCAACPHNAWGSKINPHTKAESKACSDAKKIAVVAGGDVMKPNAKVYQLSVPAASLKDLGKYVRQLNALSPVVPYNALITQVAFDTDATFPKLLFSPVRYLTTDEYAVADGKFDEQPVKLCAGLAEAAAASARRKASGAIPGQNPAAAATQSVRDQGQAQADAQSKAEQEALAAEAKAKADAQAKAEQEAKAAAEAKAKAEQEAAAKVDTPPTNDAAADSFGSGAAETLSPGDATPEAETPPTNAADSFGTADSFGGEATPAEQPKETAAATDDGGFGAEPQPQAEQKKPAASDLESVFGEGWDD